MNTHPNAVDRAGGLGSRRAALTREESITARDQSNFFPARSPRLALPHG
ncbi:hypothetical protein [Streptomyces tanashiensis]|uniref:Uncharacterized protein n=1 Tax=Streptomyces tanashiensis TaxID=67367 RepID=A0ABY6QQ84_9ACTN|nr:hypothetical protein [Streptomyces tanashiensis]UZX19263.1 hypothetical protein LDH80_00170 [Streptomyces tanashiensis]